MISESNRFEFKRALLHPGGASCAHDVAVTVEEGRVASVTPSDTPVAEDCLALPALVGACAQGGAVSALALWGHDAPASASGAEFYRFLPVDPYLNAAVVFGRQALSGCGTVSIDTSGIGHRAGIQEVRAIGKAARDVGVRVVATHRIWDRIWPGMVHHDTRIGSSAPIQQSMHDVQRLDQASLIDVMRYLEDIAAECASMDIVFQIGLRAPPWCSEQLLRAVGRMSAETGIRVQMPLLEVEAERDWADLEYPDGIVRRLDALGLLSSRLAILNGTMLRDDEMAGLADRGVSVIVNAVASLRAGMRRAPVDAFIREKLRTVFGFNGASLDDDWDALRDLRLTYLLHAHAQCDAPLDVAHLFASVHANCFFAATGETGYGRIEKGAHADFMCLDWSKLGPDVLDGTVAEEDVILSRASAAHLARLVVRGIDVVRRGRLVNVDFSGLSASLISEARRAASNQDGKHAIPRGSRIHS